jgi:hypothetical protein
LFLSEESHVNSFCETVENEKPRGPLERNLAKIASNPFKIIFGFQVVEQISSQTTGPEETTRVRQPVDNFTDKPNTIDR